MRINFAKYHALRNDFLVIEAGESALSKARLGRIAQQLCDRRAGVGADGILYVSSPRPTRQMWTSAAHVQRSQVRAPNVARTLDATDTGVRRGRLTPHRVELVTKVDVYNADGSWAEKSGNGLRIVGLHEFLKDKRKVQGQGRQHGKSQRQAGAQKWSLFEMGGVVSEVRVLKKQGAGYMVATDLGKPQFRAECVPVRTKQQYMVQAPLKIGGLAFPVTCLSVGNPHTVLFVDNFDFDWKTLGSEIEHHAAFPERTNFDFVRIVNRKKLQVAEWERGAGATGSSGTGAAAAVAAAVMNGLAGRDCEVVFEPGSLFVKWHEETDMIELSGAVEYVGEGTAEVR